MFQMWKTETETKLKPAGKQLSMTQTQTVFEDTCLKQLSIKTKKRDHKNYIKKWMPPNSSV